MTILKLLILSQCSTLLFRTEHSLNRKEGRNEGGRKKERKEEREGGKKERGKKKIIVTPMRNPG